jgi:hypothetical protein
MLSNRPEQGVSARGQVVLVADRFPVPGDPLVDFVRTLDAARVEAGGRPEATWIEVSRKVEIAYREDEGVATRIAALVRLAVRHPLRCGRDFLRHGPREPSLTAIAPAAVRLMRQPGARVHPLGGDEVQAIARRLAALAGRPLADPRRA